MRTAFVDFDVQLLRATFWATERAPPGLQDDDDEDDADYREPDMSQWIQCPASCEDGRQCLTRWPKQAALTMHLLRATGGTHGRRSTLQVLTITNTCPLCSSTFRTQAIAKVHVNLALKQNRCMIYRSATSERTQELADNHCPLCQEEFETTTDLLHHIRGHVDRARP